MQHQKGLHVKNIAVAGFGYWGKNLIRDFDALGALRMVCHESKLRYKEIEPGILRCLDLDEEASLPPELAVGRIAYDDFKKMQAGDA